MNNLPAKQTLSSREIAQLTKKKHMNVLRDCDRLNDVYKEQGLTQIRVGVYSHTNTGSQQHREYYLTKIQTLDLMTGYNIALRIKINRRWEELEKGAAPLQLQQLQKEVDRLRKDVDQLKTSSPGVSSGSIAEECEPYFTVSEYAQTKGIGLKWKLSTKIANSAMAHCDLHGKAIKKRPAPRRSYKYLNTYPESVLEVVFKEYFV